MRMIRPLFIVCLLLISFVATAQEPQPIVELHSNDSQGIALLLGQTVLIQGVVTVPSGVFHTSRTEVYIQDETGGMNLFSYDPIFNYELGDEVLVEGEIDQYRGMTEVIPTSVQLIATDQPVPAPLLMTCDDVRYTYDTSTHKDVNESLLVQVNNVTWNPDTLELKDTGGRTLMYIDGDTGIPTPEGEFNVVGVIKQYDRAEPPYEFGFEILPRFLSDITHGSGPQFTSLLQQTEVSIGGATIVWETDVACETVLEYGITTDFEMDTIALGNSTTTHEVSLEGLSSATVYYTQAIAANEDGSINSPTMTIVSPAENSSGQIDVYFSQSVDTSYSTGVDAVQTDISLRMIELIDAANTSIDLCYFSFTLDEVADALVEAHQRGVTVRFIYEVFDDAINRLTVGGIEVRTDPDEEHENTHNKFAVFDAGDGDETTGIVFTGSWNASYSGTHFNAENVVVVHDEALAKTYAIEFDEMWGGTFSDDKVNNTPHMFLIGGIPVEQYMSPTDGVQNSIKNLIADTDTDLLFAIYGFTEEPISAAMKSRFDEGVAVRGVFDADNATYEYSRYQPMLDWGADVVLDNVELGEDDEILHHKYIISDPFGSDPALETGSYNWSYTAENYKDENILIIHDATIANIFFQEWMARYREGGGTWEVDIPEDLTAEFTWDPMSPAVNEMITFTNGSTGDIIGGTWDFGDGVGTATDPNPTYVYDTAGTYTVTLEVTDGANTASVSHDIIVSDELPPLQGTPVYFAAGAAAAGASGSFWSTDAEINNRGNSMLTYSIRLLERGEDNSDPMEVGPFTLDGGMCARYTNVFGDLFDFEGAGAFAFVIDPVEDAVLTSRTFNTFDDGNLAGTFGQSIPAITEDDMIGANTKVRLIQLSADENFRTNIGFLNGTDSNIRIFVEFFLADGTSLGEAFQDLTPYSNIQWNNAFTKVINDPVADGYVDVWTEAGMFTVYASVVGNDDFNDPTTIMPQ